MSSYPLSPNPAKGDSDELARSWVKALKDCDFAGQIDLSEQDLKLLAPPVRNAFESSIETPERHALRVVFSVNCAYYAQDRGFWEYFCACLRNECTPQNQSWFGEKIDRSLLSFGFIDQPGFGAYRYVGPLLAQAGVTLRSIHRFAVVLREAAQGDWERLLALNFYEFRKVVETSGPGSYLASFLNDDSQTGWRYTRAVAKSLSQYEASLISWEELQGLPGFRPGFWKELKDYLEIRLPTPLVRFDQAPSPCLVFNPLAQQVQVSFDHHYVERRAYFFEGELVEASSWPLINREEFKPSYSIRIKRQGGDWKKLCLRGWPLDGSQKAAIFHPQKGYIPPATPLQPGTYYLLVQQGTRLPESISALTDFEYVNIVGAQYIFWKIEITPSSDLSWFGYTHQSLAPVLLSWACTGSRLTGALAPNDVFIGQLPPVRVNQAHLFRQNRLGLFCQAGSITKRLNVPGDADVAEITISATTPSAGRIWIEPLGRTRSTDSAVYEPSLTFVLLPSCSLKWPTALFSPDSQPSLTFEGPPEISADFPSCSSVAPRTWQTPQRTFFIEGNLRVGSVSLLLGHRIYRAEFVNEAVPGQTTFDLSEFDTEFPLRLRGQPAAPIRLGLSDTTTTIGFDLPQVFDPAGLRRISSFSVRDQLRDCASPAAAICMCDHGSWVQTGASFLNLASLRCWLFSNPMEQVPPWFSFLENTLSAWLLEVLRALSANKPVARFQAPSTLPASIQRWADEIYLMLFVFAEHPPAASPNPFAFTETNHLDPKLLDALHWVWAARGLLDCDVSVQTSDAAALVAKYPEWLPPRTTWRNAIQELLRGLRGHQDLTAMIEEWAAEARPPMRINLTSRIASQREGRDLTEAYICSQQSNYTAAYQLLASIERGAASGLVLDLALLLKNIALMRNNLGFQHPNVTVHKKLQPFFEGLSRLGRDQLAFPDSYPASPDVLDPQKLPLNAEDVALLRKALANFYLYTNNKTVNS